MTGTAEKIKEIKPNYLKSGPALHRTLLILVALGECYRETARLKPFTFYHDRLLDLFSRFYQEGLRYKNTHHPFGKLENSGVWELEKQGEKIPRDESSGHLKFDYLMKNNIRGGLTEKAYADLTHNKQLIVELCEHHADLYIPFSLRDELFINIGITDSSYANKETAAYNNMPAAPHFAAEKLNTENEDVKVGSNSFISYLNSLHNIHASGSNALAESQALNSYFHEIYEPFPVVDDILANLRDDDERVIVLTGHAGDGKSTIAFDCLKKLSNLDPRQPLLASPKELEEVELDQSNNKKINIVKDMSELSVEQRSDWLNRAFNEKGSWLIVSNTGPLLNTFRSFAENRGIQGDLIENDILEALHKTHKSNSLKEHTIDKYPKPLVILNITRLDNVHLGSKIFQRLINHSGWKACEECSNTDTCPIYLNKRALSSSQETAEKRVRWTYRRLTEYEQRLTLREMTAHLAYSFTGGLSCSEAYKVASNNLDISISNQTSGIQSVIFSELFFGYSSGTVDLAGQNLRAITLLQKDIFGEPVSTDQERQLCDYGQHEWSSVPDTLKPLQNAWLKRSRDSAGIQWRFALRRLLYIFGTPEDHNDLGYQNFIDSFLKSPHIRDFNEWLEKRDMTLNKSSKKKLRNSCLKVLLETYSGFSFGQFSQDHDRLYLTLRRPDKAVIQPTQFVIAEIPFDNFAIDYDQDLNHPILKHKPTNTKLQLNLPLLDYITNRSTGKLGNELSQIHLAQLEWFRSELMNHCSEPDDDEIRLLKADINGQAVMNRYNINNQNNTLEIEQ